MSKRNCPTPRKRAYHDDIAAKLALSRIAYTGEREEGKGVPVRAYQCRSGRHWHLTSQA